MGKEKDLDREMAHAQLTREMVAMAKVIGGHREQTIAEVFESVAYEPLRRQYRRVLDEMTEAIAQGGEA